MKIVFIRPANQSDEHQFVDWSLKTANNLLDPKAVLSFTVCAFNEDGPILYAPVQTPMFMEALAINPQATELEVAAALRAVTQFLVSQCYIRGVGEIYFFCADDRTAAYAKRTFEEVPYRLFRLKISDLDKS